MWPAGDVIDAEVCYCYCHRGDGGKVAHVQICCKVCPTCRLNIKFELFEKHAKAHEAEKPSGKKVA